jgi:hypothetical protein
VLATPARKLPRVITYSNCGGQNPERARRAGDALERLRRARAILSPLGVRPLLEEIDDLLGEETALSS